MANETLSEKRRRAGKLGAAARWSNASSYGTSATRNGKNGNRPAARDWFEIKNADGDDAADVYIYDQIGGGGFFWGGVSAEDFANEIKDLKVSTLNVFINSPGGDVFDGLAIMNALRRHSATVNIVVDGLAASAASFIAAGGGDNVTMMRNSQMMIHEAHGSIMRLTASEVREFADLLEKQDANIADVYAAAAGKRGGNDDVDHWRGLMADETWLSDREAVEFGLADRVDGLDDDDEDEPANEAPLDRFESIRARFKYQGREHAPAPARPAAKAPEPAPETPPAAPEPVVDLEMIRNKIKKEAAL